MSFDLFYKQMADGIVRFLYGTHNDYGHADSLVAKAK